jgi:uncharacterized membrane protein/subtilisin family serine protease
MRAKKGGWALFLALLSLGTAFFPLAAPGEAARPPTPQAQAPEHPRLWLKCGVFDPAAGAPALAPELTLSESQGYHIVQFDGPVSAGRQEWLSGVSEVLAYIPDYAYVVRGADISGLRAHPGVRYVGLFEPAYKVAPRLSFSKEMADLAVLCFDRKDQPLVVERLLGLGASIVRVDPLMIQARGPGALALAAAFVPEVQWVEEFHPPKFQNNAAAKIVRIRSQNDGGYNFGTTSLWSYNATSGKYEGYAGQNFTAALVDTGIDGTHPAFNGKKLAYYAYGYSDWTDYDGHGTHTAGTVLGNGAYRSTSPGTAGRYAGMAPLAGLVGQLGAGSGGYYTWCHDAYTSGAVVQSNSWGGGYSGTYDYSAASYDICVRDSDNVLPGNQSLSVCFSAGNLGQYGAGSVVPPSTAKNVISVGATDNSNGQSIAYFSSRGPCDDGRIKPDLMAPGMTVTSCAGNSASSYVGAQGTSMSCPVVAGACVIVNEHYNRSFGALPSPAMVKNLLINGAALMPGQAYPGNGQGWGRVDLANSLLNNTNRRIWAEDQELDLLTGVARTYLVNVTKAAEMRVSLVWTDYCGTVNAAKALVNDLDLEVTLPNGTMYRGNVLTNGWSTPNGTADSVNNIEMVRFQSAQVGKWRLDVRARNVARSVQDFALVVGGPFDNVTVARVDVAASNLTIDPADPAEGDRVSIRADIGNVGDLPVPPSRWQLTVRGEDNLTVVLNASNLTRLEPGDRQALQAEWTAVRGLSVISAVADPLMAIPEDNETNNVARLEVPVRGYGVALACDPPSVLTKPSVPANLSVAVRNLGNTFDTFALAVEGPLPAGWSAVVETPSLFVPSGLDLRVNVTVTPAADALAGDRADFRLRAVSSGNATHSGRVELSAVADQYFDFRLAGNASLQVLPGSTATHSILLDNAGNGPDAVELSMSGLPAGWGAYLSGGRFSLQAREKQRATLTVTPPAGAPALAFSNITVEATAGGNQHRFIHLATTVLQTAGVGLELADGPDSATAGDAAVLVLRVQNNGNGPDNINLSASGDAGFGFEFRDGAPQVRAGDFVLIDLELSVPRSAPAGEHIFTVRGASSVNPSVESVLELSLFVYQYYSCELWAGYTEDTVEAGNSTRFTVTLNNTGNGDDGFSLRVETATGRDWRKPVTPSSLMLALGGSASLLLKLRPPSDVAEGNYTFTLKATSSGDPAQSASVKFTVRIVAPPPPPPPPPLPPPPIPRPEPEPEPARNRYVAWVEDHWQLSMLMLLAIVALAAGGAYAAVRRRRSREPAQSAPAGPPEAAIAMAPSAYAASPPPPAPPEAPASEKPPEPAQASSPPSAPVASPEEPMETVDMGPPAVPEPEPAPPRPEAPVPQIPSANRRSDGPSPTAKRAVDDEIDEILARLGEDSKK